MATNTIRIDEQTHRTLRTLASEYQLSMGELVHRAVEELRRRHLLEETNAAYDALRSNAQAWREEQEEREAWDATLTDGVQEQ